MPLIRLENDDVIGLVKTSLDAHTLGLNALREMLVSCGYKVIIANNAIAAALENIDRSIHFDIFEGWVQDNHITRLGFSYRLDPADAHRHFFALYRQLYNRQMLAFVGGPIRTVYFAGLPGACMRVERDFGRDVPTFRGDESPLETLERVGVAAMRIPRNIVEGSVYDDQRLDFGKALIEKGEYHQLQPVDRSSYADYGTKTDHVVKRIRHCIAHQLPPLTRVHVGPYDPERKVALQMFKQWLMQLRDSQLLDVVSLGVSQLTQSSFGEAWGDKSNGGGIPINSAEEYYELAQIGLPMLMRTYAGTRDIPKLAEIHEKSLNIAWHALSFWWFCQIDGRGPYGVLTNLTQHLETLRYIAKTDKPYEPNIPHHFAFRGGDDVSYVLSAYLAAKTAKQQGVPYLILQVMLNTPKNTWGVQDLAKAKALLRLVRLLEDDTFKVFLQPRAGLDYFSPDLNKARVQLAAVTAMMDDIDPFNIHSPHIIHVVSYSEASHLAGPNTIIESLKITQAALRAYRQARQVGEVEHMGYNKEVLERTNKLYQQVRDVLAIIDRYFPDSYSPKDLYQIFAAGFMPVPYLWHNQEEFRHAIQWKTKSVNGGVQVVDENGQIISPFERAKVAAVQLDKMQLLERL
jgi:hypothetical protein